MKPNLNVINALKTPASRSIARVYGSSTGNRAKDAILDSMRSEINSGKYLLHHLGKNRLDRAAEAQLKNRGIIAKLMDIIPGHRNRLKRSILSSGKLPEARHLQNELNKVNGLVDNLNMNAVNSFGHFGAYSEPKISLQSIIDKLYRG